MLQMSSNVEGYSGDGNELSAKNDGNFFTSFTNIKCLWALLLGSKYLLIHTIYFINNLGHNTNFHLIFHRSTHCSPKVLGLIFFFKNRRYTRKTHSFFNSK